MNALQSIAVVNGRPSIFGDGAIGLVRGSGLLEWIEETVDRTNVGLIATCRVKRRNEPTIIERTFFETQAKTAALWDKPGPWQTYRERMLQMRARAFALRDGFADVLKGLGIKEEVEDIPVRDPIKMPPKPQRVVTSTVETGVDSKTIGGEVIWDEDRPSQAAAMPPDPEAMNGHAWSSGFS